MLITEKVEKLPDFGSTTRLIHNRDRICFVWGDTQKLKSLFARILMRVDCAAGDGGWCNHGVTTTVFVGQGV